MSHEPGEVLDGKFRLDKRLGKGGMGQVFAGHDLILDRPTALKLLHEEVLNDHEIAKRFKLEAQIAAKIKSPYVVEVFEAGHLRSGEPYMCMELLQGETLSEVIKKGSLSVDEALDYGLQLCEGLAAAHKEGIVHRDVKPANLFLTNNSDDSRIVKILDFGISRRPYEVGDSTLTRTGVVIGTPAYSAPEQLRAERACAQSDIWSLGVVLYEALSGGRRPFEDDPKGRQKSIADLCAEVLKGEPRPLQRPDLPVGLFEVILQCLEKQAADRFPDVGVLANALTRVAPTPGRLAQTARIKRSLAHSDEPGHEPSGQLPIGDTRESVPRGERTDASGSLRTTVQWIRAEGQKAGRRAVVGGVAAVFVGLWVSYAFRPRQPSPNWPDSTNAFPPPPPSLVSAASVVPTPLPLPEAPPSAASAEPLEPPPSASTAQPTAAPPRGPTPVRPPAPDAGSRKPLPPIAPEPLRSAAPPPPPQDFVDTPGPKPTPPPPASLRQGIPAPLAGSAVASDGGTRPTQRHPQRSCLSHP